MGEDHQKIATGFLLRGSGFLATAPALGSARSYDQHLASSQTHSTGWPQGKSKNRKLYTDKNQVKLLPSIYPLNLHRAHEEKIYLKCLARAIRIGAKESYLGLRGNKLIIGRECKQIHLRNVYLNKKELQVLRFILEKALSLRISFIEQGGGET